MTSVFQSVYSPQLDPVQKTDRKPSATAIADRIEQAFDSASASTGTPFEYLVKTAQRESSMNASAKAPTSSAAGLFQFIESTWLETLKTSGPELGLGDLADKIEVDSDGRYRIPDAEDRQAILALRYDPEVSSMMAGALTKKNAGILEAKLGREASPGELYIAHFLGANGAAKFIDLAEASPEATAADYFPRQAKANKGIFYERDGSARSMATVYAELVGQHQDVGTDDATMLMAFAGADPTSKAMKALDMSEPADRVRAGWGAAEPGDAFSALFRTDHPELRATAATAFWQGYARTPGLFDVAVAEDARSLAADAAAVAAKASGASLNQAAEHAPLDLSRYLKTDGG